MCSIQALLLAMYINVFLLARVKVAAVIGCPTDFLTSNLYVYMCLFSLPLYVSPLCCSIVKKDKSTDWNEHTDMLKEMETDKDAHA